METKFLRPISDHVLLVDEQPEAVEGGVIVDRTVGCGRMDFVVAKAPGGAGFGQGDRVVVSDPNAGRRVKLDGCVYRIVPVSDIVAVME